jgi:nucleotide-binding universal stress UspA family protein
VSNAGVDTRPIVVGIDGSPGAQHALEWAITEAAVRKTSLHVVHVWEPPAPISGIGSIIAPLEAEPYERHAKHVLEESISRALAQLGGSPPMIVPTLVRGYPPTELLDATKGAQLLVIGTRGLGEFRAWLLGSVSQECLHRADCPVAVVPHRTKGA